MGATTSLALQPKTTSSESVGTCKYPGLVESGLLNNRELASLIWLGVVGVYVAWQGRRGTGLGASVASVVRQFLGIRVLVPFMLYLAWLTAGVWLVANVGLWNLGLDHRMGALLRCRTLLQPR